MSSKVLTLKGVDLHELVTEPPRHKDCYLNAPCKRCTNKVGLGVISSLSNVLTDNNAWFLSKEIAAKFIQKAYLEAFDKARMAMLSNAFNYWD